VDPDAAAVIETAEIPLIGHVFGPTLRARSTRIEVDEEAMGTMRRRGASATRVTRTPPGEALELSTEPSPRGALGGSEGRDDEHLIARRVRSTVKYLARSIVPAPQAQRRVILIFGCQRSGTTMLQQTLFDRSWRVFILEEHDRRLVGDDPDPEETDWEEDDLVFRRIHRLPFEVVAVKPLVESYRATELVKAAGQASGIWMLRNYLDVARSNLRRFGLGNAHRDLEPFKSPDSADWRCRGATEETRQTVNELLREGLEPLDAAALFWWTRNKLYFDQHLEVDERIKVLRYERVGNCPEDVIRSLSDYIGISLPIHSTVHRIRTRQVEDVVNGLNPLVEGLCAEMWESFEGCPEL